MLQRPSYEMSVTAMAPSQFEFETPVLEYINWKWHIELTWYTQEESAFFTFSWLST